jgi:hypothetical protein
MSYESIAKFTGTNATGTFNGIDFTTLPSTYKHLMVIAKMAMNFASPTAATVRLRFNNDAGSNYSYGVQGSTYTPSLSTLTSQTTDSATVVNMGRPSSGGDVEYGAITYYIPNFAGTGKKTWQAHTSSIAPDILPAGENRSWHHGGYWNSTAAITSLNFTADVSPNFASFTDISLYGLKDS